MSVNFSGPGIYSQAVGWEGIGVTTGARNTTAVQTVTIGATGSGGTGYVVGEVVTVTGMGAPKIRVTATTTGGVVSAIELYYVGTGGASVTNNNTQASTTGTGTGLTINITVTNTFARITTTIAHPFKTGDSIVFTGDAAWYNTGTPYVIAACDSNTTFDALAVGGSAAAAASTTIATLIVDSTKNWVVNEHTGKIVQISVTANPLAPVAHRRITSNTASTLTITSYATPVTGTTRYAILDIAPFGREEQYLVPELRGYGHCTAEGTNTTIIDSTKTWRTDQWKAGAGTRKVRIIAGTGRGSEVAISSHTATTLTVAAMNGAANSDLTTKYLIMDTFGTATSGSTTTLVDSSQSWGTLAAETLFNGKRLRVTSGLGQGQELLITQTDWPTATPKTRLTFALATAPDSTSTYGILAVPNRSTGVWAAWLSGVSTGQKGKYILVSRGGASNTFDVYNVNTQTWDYGIETQPQAETMTTGTMYAYDGVDRVYFQRDATSRVFYIDVTTFKVYPSGIVPYAMGTATIGNRMEIIRTADDLRYLYIIRHGVTSATSSEMWRVLIFW